MKLDVFIISLSCTSFEIEVDDLENNSIMNAINKKYPEVRSRIVEDATGKVYVLNKGREVARYVILWMWNGSHLLRLDAA